MKLNLHDIIEENGTYTTYINGKKVKEETSKEFLKNHLKVKKGKTKRV